MSEWLSSWRVALRLARCDSWSHKGRSALVLVMICVPVTLMVLGLTVWATQTIDPRESAPRRLGQSAGVLSGWSDVQIEPGLDGSFGSSGPAPARALPVPGLSDRSGEPTVAQATQAIGAYLHARVIPTGSESAAVMLDGRARQVSVLTVDAREPVLRGRVDLLSGRWPASRDEVVVTERGLRAGLPDHGAVDTTVQSWSPQGTEHTERAPLRVVGVASAYGREGRADVDLVRLPDPSPTATWSGDGLIDRAAPITAEDMADAGRHGIGLVGRAALLDPGTGGAEAQRQRNDALLVVSVLSAGLLVESALLAGPAFAVIAQRQRRTLALAASNGATRAQLRRTVLAQALVLGVASSLVATAAGIGGAALGMRLAEQRWPLAFAFGPFDVPWLHVLVVLGVAVLASIVAALLPARGLGRLDVAAAMRGEVPPRRVRRSVPLVGLALAGLGGAGIFATVAWAHNGPDGNALALAMVAATVVLVLGALLAVPALLALLGRLGARLPVPLRMATRDAARQRGRATPTVAAVMAGSIVLSGAMLMVDTVTERDRREYVPQAPLGWLWTEPFGDVAATGTAIRAHVPGATVHELRRASTPDSWSSGEASRTVLATAPTCTPAQAVAPSEESGSACPVVSVAAPVGFTPLVLDPAAARALLRLTPAQQQVYDAGGLLTTDRDLAARHRLEWHDVDWTMDEASQQVRLGAEHRRVTLPVAPLQPGQLIGLHRHDGAPSELVLGPAGVRALGIGSSADRFLATAPGGRAVTEAERAAVSQAVDPVDDSNPLSVLSHAESVHVERGFQDPLGAWRWGLLGLLAALALVATTSATALAMGEAQRDLDTLAAVGAPPRVRRGIAASQSGLLALVGTVVGALVGAVPGVAYARAMTRGAAGGSFVQVPWDVLAVAAVAIPLLAAGLAAVIVRSRPDLTRRPA